MNKCKRKVEQMLCAVWTAVYLKVLPEPLKTRILSYIVNIKQGDILVRPKGIDCRTLDGARIRATNQVVLCKLDEVTLLHEIVHAVGGTELESEEIEKRVYGRRATDPTPDDYVKFSREKNTYIRHNVPYSGSLQWRKTYERR